mmetsp:Transcript_35641/g.59081  ORF Transcript_35641/g.59081 Transcript_35641/m.59081 type:complete len:215 (-) Transcript_35641:62-706(-)
MLSSLSTTWLKGAGSLRISLLTAVVAMSRSHVFRCLSRLLTTSTAATCVAACTREASSCRNTWLHCNVTMRAPHCLDPALSLRAIVSIPRGSACPCLCRQAHAKSPSRDRPRKVHPVRNRHPARCRRPLLCNVPLAYPHTTIHPLWAKAALARCQSCHQVLAYHQWQCFIRTHLNLVRHRSCHQVLACRQSYNRNRSQFKQFLTRRSICANGLG